MTYLNNVDANVNVCYNAFFENGTRLLKLYSI